MTRRMNRLLSIEDLFRLPSPQWRVHSLIPVGGFTLLYAPPEQGKTFFALDLALSIASGRDFHGRKVRQGPVVYVLSEGRGGLQNRVKAWLKEHDVLTVANVFFVLDAVQFHHPTDVANRNLSMTLRHRGRSN